MTTVVLDASVVIKWFRSADESFVSEAGRLRAAFRSGEIEVAVPSLLYLEILNVAGRRWGMARDRLDRTATALILLGFMVHEPNLRQVSAWIGNGLTAYDAAYVALAESLQIPLVTADERILDVARGIAISLPEFVNAPSDAS